MRGKTTNNLKTLLLHRVAIICNNKKEEDSFISMVKSSSVEIVRSSKDPVEARYPVFYFAVGERKWKSIVWYDFAMPSKYADIAIPFSTTV